MVNNLLKDVCGYLKLSSIAKSAEYLAEEALRQNQSHLEYLIFLLQAEYQERLQRRSQRIIRAARFPWLKTLESFDFGKAPYLNEAQIRSLLSNQYIQEAKPVIFLGEPGTGKTHLAIALGINAAMAGLRVRFISTAELANQLMEAKDARTLSKVILSYVSPDLLILDELGYVPLTQADAELIFQVLSKRQEFKPIIITTNLPFSEWIRVFPDPRLCKAVIDRVTFRAQIIDTGSDSIRLVETRKLNNNTT